MSLASSEEKKLPSRFGFVKKPWIWLPFTLLLIFLIILAQVDLESVKENLIEKVSSETGLKVEIDSIGFGFSNGLGLQCKGVKVRTPKGVHYLVDRMDLLAEWSPLLSGEFKVISATLERPVIKLEIQKLKPEQPAESPTAKKGKPSEKPELFTSETIQSTTAVKLQSSPLSIEKLVISDGEITLTRSGSSQKILLIVDGTFVLNRNEYMDLSVKSVKVQTGSIIFEGNASVSNLGAENAEIDINLKTGDFSLKQLQPTLQFFEVSMQDSPLKAMNVDRLILKNKFPLNTLSKIELIKEKMAGHIDLKISNAVLKAGNFIESLKGEGIWKSGTLTHDFSGTALGSDFSINGKFPFSGFDQNSISRVEWKDLDLIKLPLPKETAWIPTQGKVSGKLSINGSIPKEIEKLKGSFELQASSLVLTPSGDGRPIEISSLTGRGDFDQGQLQHDIQAAIWGSSFDIKGKFPLNKDNSVLHSQVKWTGMDIAKLPLPPSTGWHPAEGKVSGTLTLAGPAPAKGKSFPGQFTGSIKFDAQNLKLQNADSRTLHLNKLSGNGNINNKRLNYKLKSNLFDGTMKTQGSLDFRNNKTNSDITLNHISLGWTPLFHERAPSSGTLTGNLNVRGPFPSDGKISPELKLKGKLKVEKLIFENQQIETAKVDFKSSTLTQAKVELERIKLGERNLKKATALFKITPERIDLKGGKIWPKNGLIQLAGDLQPKSGNYRLKFKGNKLMVEDLLQPAHLVGPLKVSGVLTGILPKNNAEPGLPEHARNLSGNIKLKLFDGAIPKLGVVKELLTLLNPTTALNTQKKGLSYNYLGGGFKIVKGVVHTENLEMKSPQVNMNVVGRANLVVGTVLAKVKAMPLQMLDKTIKAIPLLGQILGGGKKGGLIEIYVKVDGKLSQPSFMLQPHKSLTEKPGDILKGLLNIPKNLNHLK